MKRRAFIIRTTQQSIGLAFIPSLLSLGFSENSNSGLLSEMKEDNELPYMPDIIQTPEHPEEWVAFRNLLDSWRKDKTKEIGYDGSLYDHPEFKWVSSAFNCYFLMMYDQLFYNSKEGKYTVDHFLAESEKKFGRLDSIVLWHAYPRIGLDDRNQFENIGD